MERQNLYFIAIIPSQEICQQIDEFKLDFAHRFASRRALKVMPHITLKTPFKLLVSRHGELLEWFGSFIDHSNAFDVELDNFGAFPNKENPVVYIHPVMNQQLLSLQQDLIESFRNAFPDIPVHPLELRYQPHMTVAYRDLQPEQFRKAWQEYQSKTYHAQFKVSDIYLLQHDGTKWNIISTHRLNSCGKIETDAEGIPSL